jgi:peptide/nickel transport system substrate-binding protein
LRLNKNSKAALSRVVIVIVVAILLVVSGIGIYFLALSGSNSSSSLPGPKNSSQLVEESNAPPVTYDPASGFFSGEDEILVNTYQDLIMYNYTSATTYAPILATSWSTYPNASTYTFVLRNNAWFANSNPFNASVAWFNFYRTIIMNQIGASFFTSLLYNGTTALAVGCNVPYGVPAALKAAGYSLPTDPTLQQQQACVDLASVLSNFNPSNSTIQTIMSYAGQAVVVTGNYAITFHLINPYLDFLQVLASPSAGMIDPSFVDAHGGVTNNTANNYAATTTMGTGPYVVRQGGYVSAEALTMTENPNYWAAKLSASETNIMLTPPHIPTIVIQYTTSSSQIVQSIESNDAAIVTGPPIPSLAPSQLSGLNSTPGIQVISEPNAAKTVFIMSVLDTQQYPYNITNFRLGLAHAVNYSQIVQTVALGYGQEMVGPISPGLAYYNPGNLQPYSFDPNMAIQLIAGAGFTLNLPNGTQINPTGKALPALSISYINNDPSQIKMAQELQIMYNQIGVYFTLNPFPVSEEEADISQSGTASSYPGYLIWYWYPSWLDPVYQDLVVQSNPTYGGIFGDVSWFNDSQVNALTNVLPFLTNTTQINQDVTQVYQTTYNQAPNIWMYAIVPYWVQRNYVTGLFYNPGIIGNYYALVQYKS